MKHIATLATLVLGAFNTSAALTKAWTFEEMHDAADLVVIATPTATIDSGEVVGLPPVRAELVRLTTDFEIRLVLKGNLSTNRFLLYHHRFKKDEDSNNSPGALFSFDVLRRDRYLLFLKNQPDGTYGPVTGHLRAGRVSILKLEGAKSL